MPFKSAAHMAAALLDAGCEAELWALDIAKQACTNKNPRCILQNAMHAHRSIVADHTRKAEALASLLTWLKEEAGHGNP